MDRNFGKISVRYVMNCTCDINSGDYETPEFISIRNSIAQKPYKCIECRSVIKAGEKYERVVGKWDGQISVVRTCRICQQIKLDYDIDVYGDLREILSECLDVDLY